MAERHRLRRAAALGRLGALYGRHLARRAAARMARRDGGVGTGLARFAALYGPERITEVTPEERGQLGAQGGCVGCGLCGFAAPRAGYLRAERLPSQLTRSLPDLWVTRDLPLGGVDWAAGAAVCPLGVPLEGMRAAVEERLRRDGVEPPLTRPSVPLSGTGSPIAPPPAAG